MSVLLPLSALPRLRPLKRLYGVLLLLLITPLLTSCYVPNDFIAEIRLSRAGDYALIYKGNLTWAPLYKDIRQGLLTQSEIADKEAVLVRDLKRDSSFTEVTPLGSGTFHVTYQREGHFTGTESVTFVRRSAALLMMDLKPDGTVRILATQDPKLQNPKQLEDLGLRTQGRLRVITDLPVLKTNAPRVRQGLPNYPDYKIYDWVINSVRTPKPFLIAQLYDPRLLNSMKQGAEK